MTPAFLGCTGISYGGVMTINVTEIMNKMSQKCILYFSKAARGTSV
jgi:dipeptidyl aminopeptidase/acylaminoacyl peptidase